ncbi:uncharacterized protein TNIN_129081 [Trichonephila inaurata madagascariensis]|uniref:Uncharacterized protein n=1 Tax=Trichonephila inaurata madagascariensis TaxID=2747483 RepID=A0A8X6YXS4_9ARAC|nr:uncharacterized protein TNIN_129081 [Trichonephila inaurata madagascariensis]
MLHAPFQVRFKNMGNGTFVNSVVVQHHPFVLRSTDRRIDVACDYEEVQRKLRGGKQVLEGISTWSLFFYPCKKISMKVKAAFALNESPILSERMTARP